MWGKAVEGAGSQGLQQEAVALGQKWPDLRRGAQRGVKAETCGVGGSGASRLRPVEWRAAGHLCAVGRCGVRTVSRAGVAPSPWRPWSRRGGEVFRPLSGAGHLGVFQNVPPRRGAGGQVCSVRGMHRISFRSPLSSGVGSVGAKAAWPGGSPWSVAFPDDCGIITPCGRLQAAGRMSTG